MARQWRAGSKARAAKVGTVLTTMPTIDEVHAHLQSVESVCCYCQAQLGTSKKTKPNMDHRLPIVRGGTAELSNLGLCCSACNNAKGPLNQVEYLALLALVADWPDRGTSLLVRLRGGFWTYRPNAAN